MRLTVVDTPGFGDGLEGNGSWKACVKYVDDQFAAYFDGESGKDDHYLVQHYSMYTFNFQFYHSMYDICNSLL